VSPGFAKELDRWIPELFKNSHGTVELPAAEACIGLVADDGFEKSER
jgi:hypothetical protein